MPKGDTPGVPNILEHQQEACEGDRLLDCPTDSAQQGWSPRVAAVHPHDIASHQYAPTRSTTYDSDSELHGLKLFMRCAPRRRKGHHRRQTLPRQPRNGQTNQTTQWRFHDDPKIHAPPIPLDMGSRCDTLGFVCEVDVAYPEHGGKTPSVAQDGRSLLSPGLARHFKPMAPQVYQRWEDVVSGTARGAQQARLKRTIREGIPDALRAEIWAWRLGSLALLEKYPQRYNMYVGKAKSMAPRGTLEQIDLDVSRTFPNNYRFQTPEGLQRLRRVLWAFAVYNPTVNYCQAMNFLAAMLLLYMSEELAFWSLVQLICSETYPHQGMRLQDYYSSNLHGLQRDLQALKMLLRKRAPRAYAALRNCGIDVAAICVDWFLSFFVTTLPIRTTLRIWDALTNEGHKILFRIALALFKQFEQRLPSPCTVETVFQYFKRDLRQQSEQDAESMFRLAYSGIGTLRRRSLASLQKDAAHEVDILLGKRHSLHDSRPSSAAKQAVSGPQAGFVKPRKPGIEGDMIAVASLGPLEYGRHTNSYADLAHTQPYGATNSPHYYTNGLSIEGESQISTSDHDLLEFSFRRLPLNQGVAQNGPAIAEDVGPSGPTRKLLRDPSGKDPFDGVSSLTTNVKIMSKNVQSNSLLDVSGTPQTTLESPMAHSAQQCGDPTSADRRLQTLFQHYSLKPGTSNDASGSPSICSSGFECLCEPGVAETVGKRQNSKTEGVLFTCVRKDSTSPQTDGQTGDSDADFLGDGANSTHFSTPSASHDSLAMPQYTTIEGTTTWNDDQQERAHQRCPSHVRSSSAGEDLVGPPGCALALLSLEDSGSMSPFRSRQDDYCYSFSHTLGQPDGNTVPRCRTGSSSEASCQSYSTAATASEGKGGMRNYVSSSERHSILSGKGPSCGSPSRLTVESSLTPRSPRAQTSTFQLAADSTADLSRRRCGKYFECTNPNMIVSLKPSERSDEGQMADVGPVMPVGSEQRQWLDPFIACVFSPCMSFMH